MAYKALYRTYRPSTFDEVAGQQHIVKTIKNALKTGKLAHAYLFTGPRGTGKTTMAKLLAKALNCEEGIGCQCNECKNCKAILDGSHPDVLELDAASNNSVDDIRTLIDKVKYGTILGRYKVYIIDEVHMLSTGAFNALLKTLEEPPEHVIFVLATTEPHKILPTILSRCQRYDFTRVGEEDIKGRIATVLEEEGIPYNDAAVNLIVSLADGGMRDALSILDQVLRYSGDTLNEQDIMDVFAIESKEEKIGLIKSIINRDTRDVLRRISNYVSKGTDIKRLTDDLLVIFKDILIYKTSANTSYLNLLNKDEAIDISQLLNEDEVIEMIDNLLDAQKDFKNVPSVNSLFQITVLKMTTVHKGKVVVTKPVEETIEEVEDDIDSLLEDEPVKEEIIEEPLPKIEETPVVKPEPVVNIIQEFKQPEPAPLQKPQTFDLFDDAMRNADLPKEIIYIKGTQNGDTFEINDELMIKIMVTSKKDIKNELIGEWNNLKRMSAHPEFGKAAAMLMDGHILVASKDILILEYPLKKNAERINSVDTQKDLQSVISAAFNRRMYVYAVDRVESIRFQQNYLNKMQVNKLPKLADINIEIEVQK